MLENSVPNLLETLWAYANYTNDWELIKDRWDIVKKLFCTPAETSWVIVWAWRYR